MVKFDLAVLSFLANHLISSKLALPFSGMLMTLILRKTEPSGAVNNPDSLQQEELGQSLTLKTIPRVVVSKNNLTRD